MFLRTLLLYTTLVSSAFSADFVKTENLDSKVLSSVAQAFTDTSKLLTIDSGKTIQAQFEYKSEKDIQQTDVDKLVSSLVASKVIQGGARKIQSITLKNLSWTASSIAFGALTFNDNPEVEFESFDDQVLEATFFDCPGAYGFEDQSTNQFID